MNKNFIKKSNINELRRKYKKRVYKIDIQELINKILDNKKNWLDSTAEIKIKDLLLTAKKIYII